MSRHSVPARSAMHLGVSRKRNAAELPTPGRASAPAAAKVPRTDQHAGISAAVAAAATTPAQASRQPLATLQLSQPSQLGPSRLQPKEPPRPHQVGHSVATVNLPASTITGTGAFAAADEQRHPCLPAAPPLMGRVSSQQSPPLRKHSLPASWPKAASAQKPPQPPASAPPGRRRVVLEESDGDSE